MTDNRKTKSELNKETASLRKKLKTKKTDRKPADIKKSRSKKILAESEEKYKTLFNNAPIGIAISSIGGRIIEVNKTQAEMIGYAIDELKGTNESRYYRNPEKRNEMIQAFKKTGRVRDFEMQLRRKDGRIITELINADKVNIRGKEYLLTAGIDVTDIKHIGSLLFENEMTFRALVENSADVVSLLNADGKIIYDSPAYSRLLGYPTEERIGKSTFDLVHPDDRKNLLSLFADILKKPDIIPIPPTRVRHKNGSWIWIEGTVKNLLNEPGINALVVNFRDITNRKAAEEALQASEEKFKYIFDNSIIGKSITLATGELNINKAFSDMLGYSQEELNKRRWQDITHPDDVALNQKVIDSIISGEKESMRFLKRYIHKDGSIVWGDVSTSLRRDQNGKPLYFITSVNDITERKRVEEALNDRDNLYRKLSSNVPGMIYQFLRKPDGSYCAPFCTEAIKDIFGCSPEDIRADFSPITRVVLPEDFGKLVESIENSAKHLTLWQCEYRVQIPGQPVRWLFGQSTPEKLADGSVIWYGFNTDITEVKNIQEALQQSQDDYKRLFEEHSAVKLLIDPDTGSIVDANPAAVEYYGWSREELKQMNIFQINTLSAEGIKHEMEKARTGKEKHFEFQHRRADGSIRNVDVYSSRIKIRGKDVLHSIIHDVTERKQAEEALRESTNRLQTVVTGAPIVLYSFDCNGIFTLSEGKGIVGLGVKPGEIVGKTIYEVYGDQPEAIANLRRALSGETFTVEQSFPSGFLYEISHIAMRDENGEYSGTIGLLVDITERKRAEEALREKEKELLEAQAISHIGNWKVVFGKNGKENWTGSAELRRIYGYPLDMAINGIVRFDKIYPDDREEAQKNWLDYIQGKGSDEWECRIIVDEKIKWIHVRANRKYDESGRLISIEGTDQEITEQKTVQQEIIQMQKMQSIGTLAGGVAHDFNNILGIILAYSSSLERQIENKDKILEYGRIITQAVDRGAALVRQILTFARQTDIHIALMNVTEMIQELLSMLKQTFPKIITFIENIDENAPFINADRAQIYQALLNLCVNARDAMPNGGSIIIRIKKQTMNQVKEKFSAADQRLYLLISITDTGIGMDEETRLRIFDPFFTTKEKGKGTGLGLAVVYGVVQAHRGFMDVESKLNHGTTFNLYFPCPYESYNIEYIPSAAGSYEKGGTETILFVEDEEALTEMVCNLLKSKGYKVYKAKDGIEAVQEFENHKENIDIVISDMGLPNMTGVEVFRKLKEIDKNVFVILASGFFEPDIKSELFKAGAKGFIQKPYKPHEVLHELRRVLEIK
ncbi:MAG: PAS domain S-box protein [Bacteroidetes bacterium]|nr:PAS domain S-box protein [Bacteroidota bacterium]